ncbi:MAG: hypothetical protein R3F51_01480 [Cyanobacteriota/Melainabacteria group bacterium]
MSKADQDLKEFYDALLSYITTLALQYDLDVSCVEDNPLKFIAGLRDEEFLNANLYDELEIILIYNRASREGALNEEIIPGSEPQAITLINWHCRKGNRRF